MKKRKWREKNVGTFLRPQRALIGEFSDSAGRKETPLANGSGCNYRIGHIGDNTGEPNLIVKVLVAKYLIEKKYENKKINK